MFTTYEVIDTAISYRVKLPGGTLKPLNREEVFVMIHESLSHRVDAPSASKDLTDTLFGLIHAQKSLIVEYDWLAAQAYKTLYRFDKPAAVRYKALYF